MGFKPEGPGIPNTALLWNTLLGLPAWAIKRRKCRVHNNVFRMLRQVQMVYLWIALSNG
jgi:hypothetical protein